MAEAHPNQDASPTAPGASASIESVLHEERRFEPPAEFASRARIGSMQADRDLVAEAEADPDAFWGARARQELHWFTPFEKVLDWSNPPAARWFEGGTTNLSYNCLDRHLEGPRADKLALIWEGEPGDERRFTYRQLHAEVGIPIVKDSSANKCGVICSSFEVLAGLCLTEEEFIKEKPIFVKE
jgi:hypothetical protein